MKRTLVASLLAVLPLLVQSTALAAVLDARYVQAPHGSEAVAAAEVVAAAMGKPGADLERRLGP